ncbi:hypothetical protein FM107_13695 [Sphingobacterium sp. JB170]|nr:hypothetical protein FM107_13695 [Sphingobacterium sp. JB170]
MYILLILLDVLWQVMWFFILIYMHSSVYQLVVKYRAFLGNYYKDS